MVEREWGLAVTLAGVGIKSFPETAGYTGSFHFHALLMLILIILLTAFVGDFV